MTKYLLTLFAILVLGGCRTYVIDSKSAAQQMCDLKVKREIGTDIGFGSVRKDGSTNYSNGLKYLVVKSDSFCCDTIVPFDMKFYLKSGLKSGYINPETVIFMNGFFISFNDTTLKTNPKCKLCRINIDSVEKITIRGPRLNKLKCKE